MDARKSVGINRQRWAFASTSWTKVSAKGYALYSYTPDPSQALYQLSFELGDQFKIEEELEGWYKGVLLPAKTCLEASSGKKSAAGTGATDSTESPTTPKNVGSTEKRGIFPKSYVHVVRAQEARDPVTKELRTVLREWVVLMRQYYAQRKISEYERIRDQIKNLLGWNRILSSPHTSPEVVEKIKLKVIKSIEQGRRVMGLDMIIRTSSGEPATEKNTPIVDLYRMHKELAVRTTTVKEDETGSSVLSMPRKFERAVTLKDLRSKGIPLNAATKPKAMPEGQEKTGTSPKAASSLWMSGDVIETTPALKHSNSGVDITGSVKHPFTLLFELKVSMCQVGEPTELYFSLYDIAKKEHITEEFRVFLTAQGLPPDINAIGTIKTFFEVDELTTGQIHLACRMLRKGKLIYDDTGRTNASQAKARSLVSKDSSASEGYRRPFACSVINLSNAGLELNKETELSVTLYAPREESQFAGLVEALVNQLGTTVQPTDKGQISIGLTLYAGTVEETKTLNETLQAYPVQQKLGLPDVVLPGHNRNDFYLTLDSAVLASEGTEKNAELLVTVRDENGNTVPGAVCFGSGSEPSSEYRSWVLYKNGAPRWNETIRISIQPQDYARCHLYFCLQSASRGGKTGKKANKVFSYTFARLTNNDGTVLSDGFHELQMYKPPKQVDERVFYLRGSDAGKQMILRKGESLKIRTLLCSTSLTQNSSMLALLNWQKDPTNLGSVLNKFSFVDSFEIIKFIRETFDSMFSILVSPYAKNDIQVCLLTYEAIVRAIGILVDDKTSRFVNFRGVLDYYIERHLEVAKEEASEEIPKEGARKMPPPRPPRRPAGDADKMKALVFNQGEKISKESQMVFAEIHNTLMKCLKDQFLNSCGTVESTNMAQNSKKLIPTLKALEYLFKIIVFSRMVYEHLKSNQPTKPELAKISVPNDVKFRDNMLLLFDSINGLMSQTSDLLIGAQTVALKQFDRCFPHLYNVFTIQQLSSVASKFIESVQMSEAKNLNVQKLQLITSFVAGDLFENDSSRELLSTMVINQLRFHITRGGNSEEQRHCIRLLFFVIDQLQGALKDKTSAEQVGLVSLLPDLITSLGKFSGEDMKQDVVVCILSILYMMEPGDYSVLMRIFTDHTGAQHFLKILFKRLLSFIQPGRKKNALFPENWFGMTMFLMATLSKVLNTLGQDALPQLIIKTLFSGETNNKPVVPPRTLNSPRRTPAAASPHARPSKAMAPVSTPVSASALAASAEQQAIMYDMLANFFELAIEFITSRSLMLEHFGATKQALVKKKYGDMRLAAMQTFQKVWKLLDNHQTHFLKMLAGPFLQLAMLEEETVKMAGLDLYFSALVREFRVTQSFRGVEQQTIDTLDKLVNHSYADSLRPRRASLLEKGGGTRRQTSSGPAAAAQGTKHISDDFKEYFSSILRERFEAEPDNKMREEGLIFLGDMQKLLKLLTSLRMYSLGDENNKAKGYEDDRTEATVELMEYLKQTDRRDKYLKYVHDLVNQHKKGSHFVEAGLTILLHADLLDWSDKPLPPAPPSFPQVQKSWERKEQLYLEAVEYFDKGKYWEKAVELLEQMRQLYQNVFYDYNKLSHVQTKEAHFYRSIANEQRFYPEYFYVGYWGRAFPEGLANTEYIYRGYELERASDFQARIKSQYPSAELLTYTEAPSSEVRNQYKQFLQIYSVKPSCEEERDRKEKSSNDRMPLALQKFKEYNDVNIFVYSQPFRKSKEKQENEFEDLWIRNRFFETTGTFPTIKRRLHIKTTTIVELTPLENAIRSIHNKNEELKETISKYSNPKTAKDIPVNPFTMILNGVIDAAVSGGIGMYQKAFLTESFERQNPELQPLLERLKFLIVLQSDILQKGLEIHGKVCSEDMTGLQQQLEIKLGQLRNDVSGYRVLVEHLLAEARYNLEALTGTGNEDTSSSSSASDTSCDSPRQPTGFSRSSSLYGSNTGIKLQPRSIPATNLPQESSRELPHHAAGTSPRLSPPTSAKNMHT